MTLLSIWTGAWTVRAAILAQMVSFFLVTPEIMGLERIEGIHRAGRGCFAKLGFGISLVLGCLIFLCFHLGLILIPPFVLYRLTGLLIVAVLGGIAAAALCLIGIVIFVFFNAYVALDPDPDAWDRVRWSTWVLFFPMAIPILVMRVLDDPVESFRILALRLLASPVSVRRMVFGTGVLLFVGAMLIELMATI